MEYTKIALTGPMYSGKTTLARALEQEGYMYIPFSGLLKKYVSDMLCAVGVPTTPEYIDANKKKFRYFLQEAGEVLGFGTEAKYIYEALKNWTNRGYPPAVFDNARTLDQARILKHFGFKLVGLTLSPIVQEQRAHELGISREQLNAFNLHPAERGISPDLFDLTLDGADSIETHIRFLLGEKEYSNIA